MEELSAATGISSRALEQATPQGGLVHRGLRSLVCRRLVGVRAGRLELIDGGERWVFGRDDGELPAAKILVRDPRFYRHALFGGSLGAAEAYIRGFWDCSDLVSLVRFFCRNPDVSSSVERGPARIIEAFSRAGHWLRSNTLSGSRRNIAAHYDLGNEFFSLFLDDTMAYSCAQFPAWQSSLYEASIAKFDGICQKLELSPSDHLLEIGTGWGGFAVYAAQRYGCRVTTTTISQKQYDFARERVRAAGLDSQVRVLNVDYRQLGGTYDKLVSIEMIEAVGYEYFDTFFRTCAERLKPDGMMLLQAIIMREQGYERYLRSVDFIQRYIFPGGCLPSVGAICHSVGRASGLQLLQLEDITPHYAETLARWRLRFHENLEQIRSLGFGDDFLRTWHYYFCYCEGAFRERATGVVQMLFGNRNCGRGLPSTAPSA
ncbi:MAG: class I SAM-dependent methyltransferase [Planctomycetota bacterium]